MTAQRPYKFNSTIRICDPSKRSALPARTKPALHMNRKLVGFRKIVKQSSKGRRRQYQWNKIVAKLSVLWHGRCPVQTPDCTGFIEGGHHKRSRAQGGTYTEENCLVCCNSCHRFIHEHPTWAVAHGYMIARGDIIVREANQ